MTQEEKDIFTLLANRATCKRLGHEMGEKYKKTHNWHEHKACIHCGHVIYKWEEHINKGSMRPS